MNRSIGCLLLTSALIIGWTGLASAQEQSSQPLEVTAQDSLEWHRTEKFFIAKGDALASQGDAQISGQTLTAFYSDTNKSNFDIHKLEADTNVKIDSRGTQVLGDHLVYDLPSGQATMTGKDLKIIAPDQTVTARDKFEYDMNKGEFKAYGNALVRRAQDTLQADLLVATMKRDSQGKSVLDTLDATGNVEIKTTSETLTGEKGFYNAKDNTAQVTGNVRITRGPNILEGARADIDLTTQTSRLYAPSGPNGRVRGIFFPSSKSP